jgi:hypothetical protein
MMQDRPHLVPLLGEAPLIVMHLRQQAVAAFNRRGGALKGFDPVGRPCLPLRKDVRGQPLRDGGLLKRRPHRFQGLWSLGFPSAAPRTRHLGGPIDHREEARVHPLLPLGREEEGLQVLVAPLPPEVHQRGQSRDLCADLGHGLVTGRQLIPLR